MTMTRKTERTDASIDTVVTVGEVRFGSDPFPVIAGPCAVESEEQIRAVARIVAEAGADVLRGGTVASASAPYAFAGLGMVGVDLLIEAGREVGLPVVTQVNEPRHVAALADKVDMLEIAANDMQNFELLRVAGETRTPVLLKRAPSATIDEWLWAAEYILAEGNDQVVMCERGIRTFGDGPTLDITSVPVVKERSHLPVIVFPSHAAGTRHRVAPLALASLGVGANGVVVEVHNNPDAALTNREQQLGGEAFDELMSALGVNRMRIDVDQTDRELVRLLARRRDIALAIGRMKAQRGLPVHAPGREAELLAEVRQEASIYGLDEDYVQRLFEEILEQSRLMQQRERGEA